MSVEEFDLQQFEPYRKLEAEVLDLRAKNRRLKKAVDIALDYLKEWARWFKGMGKHQQYDFQEKIAEIDQALKDKQ